MSKFFKNIMRKEKEGSSDDITNYLIAEIEDIVSRKVGSYNFNNHYKEDNNKGKFNSFNKKNNLDTKTYSSHINYSMKKGQPFKASKYIDEDNRSRFLPFEETEIKPKIQNEEENKNIVTRTLRPALDQWLDDNLEIIIEKAIKRNYDRYNTKKERTTFDYDD